MPRDFQPFPDPVRIETDIGSIEVTAVGKDTVSVRTDTPVTVRGIDYTVSGHFECNSDGEWVLSNNAYRSTIGARRADNWKDASHAADKAIEKAFSKAVTEFAEIHPELLLEGERSRISSHVYHLDRQIEKLETDLNALYKERKQWLEEEAKLDEGIAPGPRP